MRPSWDEYYMGLAFAAAERATCRIKVGCVIVDRDTWNIVTGYNGAPSGARQCDELGGCLLDDRGHCVRPVHAEANALLKGRGKLLYCTHLPCLECSKLIVNAHVEHVFYVHDYVDQRCQRLMGMTQDVYLMHHGVDVTPLGLVEGGRYASN